MLKFEQKQLKVVDDPKGLYTFCEVKDFIDWEIKRVYFIQKSKGSGQHCHFVENEFFTLVSGTCIAIIDRGNGKEDIPMKGPGDGISVGNHVWHGFKDMSDDCILLAFSSTNYNPDRSDYCEDYEEYRSILKEKFGIE
ncbi:FdtA/QdtA family cupin domain-containing protein [Candidatus Nomurabacteria bacterium]|nr:FdtA/QdtA family cupin domain-containing protein [Candidatus Nomurabacteria bacterium]